jgi:hypothetical protein
MRSFQGLIPFYPSILNYLRRAQLSTQLDSILFLCSQAHILAGCRLETQLTQTIFFVIFEPSARTTQKTQSVYFWGVFTAPLHDNGSYAIFACVFIAAGMCLLSSCLAMDVAYDFIVPAFGRHVTICTVRTNTSSTLQYNFIQDTTLIIIQYYENTNIVLPHQLFQSMFSDSVSHHEYLLQ